MEQLAGRAKDATGDSLRRLTQTVDALTEAVRELSWILLDRWQWVPVEDKKHQPTSMRSAT